MPDLPFASALSFLAALRPGPLLAFRRGNDAADDRPELCEPRPLPAPGVASSEGTAAVAGAPEVTILRQRGRGRIPTIVLGGLVPDASEQVFLLRRFLAAHGDIYYVHYPRDGFSLDTLCVQLGSLVAGLGAAGRPPVMFGVSFGAGVAMEWLRRCRSAGDEPQLAGIVFVSPVACVDDIMASGARKPSTLIGRALKPVLEASPAELPAAVEKGRALFLRMFAAGAQNTRGLKGLLGAAEAAQLHDAIAAAIRGVTPRGAIERVRALAGMRAPHRYFSPQHLPLAGAPALVLFSQCEEAVMDAGSPTRFAFERAARAYFPQVRVACVTARGSQPAVQHASLIFHVFDFLPHLRRFYQGIKRRPLPLAA